MKQRKRKPVNVSPILGIGTLKSQIAIVEADNPLYAPVHAGAAGNPRKISVAVNLKEGPIAWMRHKGIIDDAQKKAADRFRQLWEAVGGAGAKAMDTTKEPVDGGGAREPITDRQIDAGLKLKECRAIIGHRAYMIVEKVCGEGYSINDFSHTQRERKTNADYLKDALTDLSVHFGYASKPGRQRLRA